MKNISIRKTHWLAQGLRKVKFRWNQVSIMATQNFKRNFLLILYAAAAAAKSLQSCPTLCDPVDGSPPGSPVPRILQARTLELVEKKKKKKGSDTCNQFPMLGDPCLPACCPLTYI